MKDENTQGRNARWFSYFLSGVKVIKPITPRPDLKRGQVWKLSSPDETNPDYALVWLPGEGEDRGYVRVVPISFDLENATDGDMLVHADESPLARNIILEIWNEIPIATRALRDCFGELGPELIRMVSAFIIHGRNAVIRGMVPASRTGLPMPYQKDPRYQWRQDERERLYKYVGIPLDKPVLVPFPKPICIPMPLSESIPYLAAATTKSAITNLASFKTVNVNKTHRIALFSYTDGSIGIAISPGKDVVCEFYPDEFCSSTIVADEDKTTKKTRVWKFRNTADRDLIVAHIQIKAQTYKIRFELAKKKIIKIPLGKNIWDTVSNFYVNLAYFDAFGGKLQVLMNNIRTASKKDPLLGFVLENDALNIISEKKPSPAWSAIKKVLEKCGTESIKVGVDKLCH